MFDGEVFARPGMKEARLWQPLRFELCEALAALDRLGIADFAERPFGELSVTNASW